MTSDLKHLLTFFAIVLTLVCARTASAGVHVDIAGGRMYKLGILDEGSVMKRSFLLRNSGSETLHLIAVRTSCGCTVARPGSTLIAPGDTTTIEVAFNTAGFDGPVRKQVFLHTNAPGDDSVVTITMDATVRAIIAVKPNFVDFHQAPRGKSVTKSFTVTNNSGKTVTIRSITCPDSLISFGKMPVRIKPHASAEISATYRVTRRGHIINQFSLHTNYLGKEEMKISYVGDGL